MQAERLTGFIKDLGPAAVALSSGVDSAVVASAAFRAHGGAVLAVTVVSELLPETEGREASEVAAAIGIRHRVIRVGVLGNEAVASNPVDRCYHCKLEVFSAIREAAEAEGLKVVLDGTNADDPNVYRPGLKALMELGVKSPLLDLGITKADVRGLARELGLPNHDRPSSPCLATRFPYGVRLTPGGMARVRDAEDFIRSMGVKVLRVRDHDRLARIEVGLEDIPFLASEDARKKIVAKLRSLGYNYVSVDLEGFRSGSLDLHLGK